MDNEREDSLGGSTKEVPAIPGWEIPGPAVVVGPSDAWGTSEPGPAATGVAPPATDRPVVTGPRRGGWFLVAAVAAGIGAVVGAGTALAFDGRDTTTTTVREVAPGPALGGGVAIPAIVEKVTPSVVSIEATGSSTAGSSFADQGSGMIADSEGEVLTNDHVVAGADSVTVTLYGKTTALAATVEGTDPVQDLALVKIDAPPPGLQPVTFGDSTQLQVGDAVIALGNALGLSAGTPTVTSGIVSALGRTVEASDVGAGALENLTDMIQTDAAINSGNSGGALVDSTGDVVGMNTAVASSGGDNAPAQNIGFAIPSSTIEGLLPTLRSGGSRLTERTYLGVEVEDETQQLQQAYAFVPSAGAVVVRVLEASPADTAGVEEGDVIVSLGGHVVGSATNLTTAVQDFKPGDQVEIVLWRGRQRLIVTAPLGSMPLG